MKEQSITDIVVHIIVTPLLITSIIGNVLTIIVKFYRKKKRAFNSGDLLIVNLAVCDLNKTWMMYIIWIYSNTIQEQWQFSNKFCIGLQKLIVILFSVTSITLLVLTVERYYLIMKPFDRSFSLRRVRKFLALIWIFVIALASVPGFASYHVIEIDGIVRCVACQHANIWVKAFEIAYLAIVIFIPLIAIFVLSGKASRRLCKSMRSCCKHVKVSRKINEKIQRNKNAINMLRSISLGGFLCYGTWAVIFLLQIQSNKALDKVASQRVIQPIIAWMIFGGFSNAPMTYFFFSKEFRKEARGVFSRKRKSTVSTIVFK